MVDNQMEISSWIKMELEPLLKKLLELILDSQEKKEKTTSIKDSIVFGATLM